MSIANNDKLEIRNAMRVIEKHTCIEFPLRTTEKDFIKIKNGGGCYSYVGKQGGAQVVSIRTGGCMRRGTIQHEFIHALGYDHMQNHVDRDKYVTIMYSNIIPKDRHNFEKFAGSSNFDTPYDYRSVMHYEKFAFAIDRKKPTIVAKMKEFVDIIGQRETISAGDIRRLNRMYNCKDVTYA